MFNKIKKQVNSLLGELFHLEIMSNVSFILDVKDLFFNLSFFYD